MGYKNFRQIKAIQNSHEKKIKSLFPELTNNSGIYIYTRKDESDINYAYVGQAVNICQRLASHMTGYQHIDLSLKKRGFYSENNPYGWKVKQKIFDKELLNEKEQYYIREYALKGYQLLNKTTGSQGEGKEQLHEYKAKKGYRDGIKQGEENARKFIVNLFEKHLDYSMKNENNKNHQKAYEKLEEFLNNSKEIH